MNKDKLKGFAAGVAASLLVSAAVVPAVAAGVTKTAELYYNNIKVVIEGKQADLKDALGNPVEPFAINGTTYLPVRAVANALDQAVSWDGKTQTVYIGASEEMEQPSVWLKDLDVFVGEEKYVYNVNEVDFGGSLYNNYLTDNVGNVYDNCLALDGDTKYVINGKYEKFKGTFYLYNANINYNYEHRILVYGDDELLYTSDSMTSGVMPIDFDVDVTNVQVLRIVTQAYLRNQWYTFKSGSLNIDTWSYINTIMTPIGNAGLYVAQEAEEEATVESETEPVDIEVVAE